MYRKIMIPVDLAHVDALGNALRVGANLAKHFAAPACYVGVTAAAPSATAHNPQEYAAKLEAFAAAQALEHGHEATSHACVSHDPSVDVDDTLLDAVDEIGADLVVMASHLPSGLDHLLPSHGGKLAAHATISVMLVR